MYIYLYTASVSNYYPNAYIQIHYVSVNLFLLIIFINKEMIFYNFSNANVVMSVMLILLLLPFIFNLNTHVYVMD